MNLNSLALIINGAITSILGGYILYSTYLGRFEKHLFYYLFGVGFMIYGAEIFLRAFHIYRLYWTLMFYCSLLLFAMGLWRFTRKRLFSAIIIAIFSLLFSFTFAWEFNLTDFLIETTPSIGSIAYIPLISLIIYHRVHFGRIAERFVFGWILLFLTNFITFGMGWITDFFAVFSKLVLLYGIKDYDFIVLAQRIRRGTFLKSLPTTTGHGEEGGLKLVILQSHSYKSKTDWVEKAILENVRRGVNTFVFSFQDVVPYKELRKMKWIKPEKVSIFSFSSSAEKAKEEFIVLPMGITQIGAALSQVIKGHSNLEGGIVIFFMDLSLLIHLFGVYPVYNMLLNKMGSLREGGVHLFAFFHPETHSEKSVISLFKNIADEVVT